MYSRKVHSKVNSFHIKKVTKCESKKSSRVNLDFLFSENDVGLVIFSKLSKAVIFRK